MADGERFEKRRLPEAAFVDRVKSGSNGDVDWKILRDHVVTEVSSLAFAVAGGPTTVTFPVTFGGPVVRPLL